MPQDPKIKPSRVLEREQTQDTIITIIFCVIILALLVIHLLDNTKVGV